MKARQVEWSIDKAMVNMDDVESGEIMKSLSECVRLIKEGKSALASRALPPLRFEWDWSNADAAARDLFSAPNDFSLLLTEKNSSISLAILEDHLVLSAAVRFQITPRQDLSKSALTKVINERSLVHCGYVSGGWSYLQDDGQELRILS